MIAAKILTLLGLCVPHPPETPDLAAKEQHLAKQMRRAEIASWQNRRLNATAQENSLDRIEQYVSDDRPQEIAKDVAKLHGAMNLSDMLSDLMRRV